MPMLKILDSASMRSSGFYIFAFGIIELLKESRKKRDTSQCIPF